MYKVIVMDDEPIIRQGLRTIINWAQYGIELCGEADNGIDGLRLCLELKPDAAIVDIKMPGLDGLQVIGQAKAQGLQTDFIVLSGYSEFKLAQKAAEYGVRSYLLKPLEQEELARRLELLREQWQQRDKDRQQREGVRHLTMECRLLQQLQAEKGPERLEEEDCRYWSSRLGLPWESYQIALLDGERDTLKPAEASRVIEQLRLRMPEESGAMVFLAAPYIAILAPRIDPWTVLHDVLQEASEQDALELVMALGSRLPEFPRIGQSFREAGDHLRRKFFGDRVGRLIVPAATIPLKGHQDALPAPDGLAEAAAEAAAVKDKARLEAVLTAMDADMLQLGWDEKQVKSGYIGMLVKTVHILAEANNPVKGVYPSLKDMVEGLDRQTTLQNVRSHMVQELLALAERLHKERKGASLAPILAYISAHLGSDLKLESLAEQFHYNSSYLGKLFRSQTGETFNAYLDRTRIGQAKRLLAEGRKVYEVAEDTGYCSVDYFHQKFRKLTGQTPSQYKRQQE
jgi:two-component system, response regulator YesN